jgi:hypothetical protein
VEEERWRRRDGEVEEERCEVLVNTAGVMKCRKMLTKVRMKKRSLL